MVREKVLGVGRGGWWKGERNRETGESVNERGRVNVREREKSVCVLGGGERICT